MIHEDLVLEKYCSYSPVARFLKPLIEILKQITIYEGLAVHAQSKATRLLPQKNRFPVGQRAHHVNTVNVGT